MSRRIEQLGNLLTAMIAVIVSGSSDLLADGAERKSRAGRKSAARYVAPFSDVSAEEFQKGGKYAGLHARVARQLGVARGSVCIVARGRGKSARIMRALEAEKRRVDSLPAPPKMDALSPEVLAELSRGGKYYGLYATVARQLRTGRDLVGRAAKGQQASARLVDALRVEIARVDAELAAKTGGQQ